MNARKTKTVIPIVIAVAVLGAAMAVMSSSAAVGAQPSKTSSATAASTTGGPTNNNATTSPPAATVSPIKMSAKEESDTYRWSTSDGGNNPTLKMSANANNVVQIANPTDAKHELVIESNGKQVATSGDIAPNGSGHLEFKPTAAGTFEYHCEYHPATMKGTIEVTKTS